MTNNRLYIDPALAQFYDLENGWGADLDFCLNLAEDAGSILDLGCGTGLLISRLAGTRRTIGVDPADAMLAIARRQPGGDQVTWVEADARELRLDLRFDLIVLTGHAFQVFLTEEDQRAVLLTIAAHLTPGGRFIFDARNPADKAWLNWNPDRSMRTFLHPLLGEIKAWNNATHEAASGIVTYETNYQVVSSLQNFSAVSKIKFTDKEQIEALISDSRLTANRWLGNWSGNGYTESSVDIIPIGRLA